MSTLVYLPARKRPLKHSEYLFGWRIYKAVYLESHPDEVHAMLQYKNDVCNLASQVWIGLDMTRNSGKGKKYIIILRMSWDLIWTECFIQLESVLFVPHRIVSPHRIFNPHIHNLFAPHSTSLRQFCQDLVIKQWQGKAMGNLQCTYPRVSAINTTQKGKGACLTHNVDIITPASNVLNHTQLKTVLRKVRRR